MTVQNEKVNSAAPSSPIGWMMRSGVGSAERERTAGTSRMDTTLNIWQSQGQWDNRQHPQVYRAFVELWGRPDLWVSLDDIEWKPPSDGLRHAAWGQPLPLHCDVNEETLRSGLGMAPPTAAQMTTPAGLRVQGMLYLDDCGPKGGGFRCVPGFHRDFDRWVSRQPAGAPLDFSLLEDDPGWSVHNVGARAGDFVIWHSYLPHGNSLHTGARPRIAQAIAMWPAELEHCLFRSTGGHQPEGLRGAAPHLTPASATVNEEEKARRVASWRERHPRGSWQWPPPQPPDPRALPAHRPAMAATLSPLGRKLLGLDAW